LNKPNTTRLVIPDRLAEPDLTIEGVKLEVVEFGEGESKHLVLICGLDVLSFEVNERHVYGLVAEPENESPPTCELLLAEFTSIRCPFY
jgi:hypothetical protein